MRKLMACLIMLGALIGAHSLRAEDGSKVDFNNGKDGTGIIARVKKEASLRYASPLEAFGALRALPKGLVVAHKGVVAPRSAPAIKRLFDLPSTVPCDDYPTSADDPGGATPDFCGSAATGHSLHQRKAASATTYTSWVESNSDYTEALSLKSQLEGGGVGVQSGEVSSLAVPGAGPILDRWPPIATQHGVYLDQAGVLDGQVDSFSAFTTRLNDWSGKIQARVDEAKSDTDQYNAACLGRPLPPDQYQACNAYKARFDQCATAHSTSLQQFQSLVQVWNNDKQCLQTSGDSFVNTFLGWITNVVKPWSSDAKKALENACAPLVSVSATAAPSTISPRRTSTLTAQPKYADPDAKPCPTTFKWTPSQSVLGFLNSAAGQSAIFTSLGFRGTQDFRVEASDDFSTKIAGTVVTIAGGRLCPVTRTYNPSDDKTTCAYQCTSPTGPLTLPGNVTCPQIFDPE